MPRFPAVVLLAALAASPALAADPAPDASYVGQTSQGALRFEFRTSADGTRVERLLTQFRAPHCRDAESKAQGTLRLDPVPVGADGFSARGKEVERLPRRGRFEGGTQTERYRIAGVFPTADLAEGTMTVKVIVRDRDGKTISTCRHAKPIRWSADRLGLGPETEG